jgi:hypothetical protein
VTPITIGPDFWGGLVQALQHFMDWLGVQSVSGIEEIFAVLIAWLKGVNFVTQTDVVLVSTLSNAFGLNQVMSLVDAILRFSLLLAALHYAGHYYFGWPGIGESLQRIFATFVLVRISTWLMDWSLQMFNDLTQGVAVSIPDMPSFGDLSPVAVVILSGIWLVLLLRLVLVCAERIAWLAILKPLAPLAFLTWINPKSGWIGTMYIRMWIGWLVGQILVILAIEAMLLFARIGGFAGFILSCGCLVAARHAVYVLAPKGGDALLSVGPFKIG